MTMKGNLLPFSCHYSFPYQIWSTLLCLFQTLFKAPLGPLHMPANIGGVEACKKIFPDAQKAKFPALLVL